MNRTQAIKAGELALKLSWGYADLPEVIKWADEQIALESAPDYRLISLSLSQGPGEAAGFLRSMAADTDKWLVLSYFLARFFFVKEMSSKEASCLAKRLYLLVADENVPEPFGAFASHWDAIDLAVEGYFADPEKQVQHFLADIREVVRFNGGPDFDELTE